MQHGPRRVTVLTVVTLAGFVGGAGLASCGGDADSISSESVTKTTQTETTQTTETDPVPTDTGETVVRIEVRDGVPAGGIVRETVGKGEQSCSWSNRILRTRSISTDTT